MVSQDRLGGQAPDEEPLPLPLEAPLDELAPDDPPLEDEPPIDDAPPPDEPTAIASTFESLVAELSQPSPGVGARARRTTRRTDKERDRLM
jgi:hypothetical protein